MIDVLKHIVENHIDMIDEISDKIRSIAIGPLSSQKGINYFNSGKDFTYQGVTYSIGTSFDRGTKLAQIRNAIMLTGENPHDYVIEGLFDENQMKKAEMCYAEAKKTVVDSSSNNNDVIDVLCCFLSKYNDEAAHKLGCNSINNAFGILSQKYGIKESTLKNLRDTFDPFFPESGRRGWWQKMDKISDRRKAIIDKFKTFNSVAEAYDYVKLFIE